ncbi:hypothetical protein DIPPA_19988 [Diplonema papillatum]|nr:hypothetical protein DIPPA_19988 [Diplonema papillatum]
MPAKGRAKASAAPAAARAKRRAPGSKGFAAVCRALQNGQKSNATHKRLSGQLLSTQAQWGTEGASFADSLWQALCHVLPSALTQGVDKIMRLVQQLLAAQLDYDLTCLVEKTLDVVQAPRALQPKTHFSPYPFQARSCNPPRKRLSNMHEWQWSV